MEARHQVALAAHPFSIVGSGALKGRIEQRLAETARVDHYRKTALRGHGSQAQAQIPRYLGIQLRQEQFALLQRHTIKIFGQSHFPSLSFIAALASFAEKSSISMPVYFGIPLGDKARVDVTALAARL